MTSARNVILIATNLKMAAWQERKKVKERMFGRPSEQQLELINRLAKREFTADDVFVFGGKSAGDRIIEERYIQISPELLETFAQNAKEGVSWLLNHSWSSWTEPTTIYGRTFDARLQKSNVPGETVELHIDKYIPRSDTVKNGRSANSIIEDIENGVLFDTSIGWGSNKMVCSICNMDYYGGGCNHWRGKTYEDADGNKKTCYVIAKNPGYLMEESGVFDGAYKGAGISMCTAGDIFENPQGKFLVVDELKELPKGTNVFGVYTSKGQLVTFVKKGEHQKLFSVEKLISVDENKANEIFNKEKGSEEIMDKEKVKALFEKIGITYDENDTFEKMFEKVIEKCDNIPQAQSNPTPEYMTKQQATEALGKEMTAQEVLALAKDGIAYRNETIDSALAMGVKALGNDFPTETWKNTFATMSIQAIKDISKTWEAQAKSELKAGKKFSSDDDNKNISLEIPDDAYKVK